MAYVASLLQQQSEIMDRFDFDRVLKAMHALNWTWLGETVTIEDLKRTAIMLMNSVQRERANGFWSVATGGFEARIDEVCGQDLLTLSFHIDSQSGRTYQQ